MATTLERELERAIWYLDPERRREIQARRKATLHRHQALGLVRKRPKEEMQAIGRKGGSVRMARLTKAERHELAVRAGKVRGAHLRQAARLRAKTKKKRR